MGDYFIGEIRAFVYTFVPVDWVPCDGQALSVNQYQALYAIIGNTYGTPPNNQTFLVPKLNGGIAMMGAGIGPDSDGHNYQLGKTTGQVDVTLTGNQMPAHAHNVNAIIAKTADTYATPSATSRLSRSFTSAGSVNFAYTEKPLTANANLNQAALSPFAGGGKAHPNQQPYLGFIFAIATNGDFPVHP